MTSRLRAIGALVVVLALLGAGGPSRAESQAWKQVISASSGDNTTRALDLLERFLRDHPDSAQKTEALRLRGEAAMTLGQWTLARTSLESYLSRGGRDDVADVQFRVAICLAREDRMDAAPAALRNVAVNDADANRASQAARELVGLHLFHGTWRKVLQAQSLLLDRGVFDPALDLQASRQAAEAFTDAALQSLSRGAESPAVRGLAGFLLLDRHGALVDSPETEEERRRYAGNHVGHPLLAAVPGAQAMAAVPEDTRPDAVGVLLPLSGRYADPAERVLRGISLAMSAATARAWPEIELIPVDTAGNPEQALAGLQTLVDEHRVIAILGPMISAEAEAVVAAADELSVPLMMMVQRPGLAEGKDSVFNTWVTAEEQVDALVEHAVKRLGVSRFAIAYPSKASSARLVERFWSRLEDAGGHVTAVEAYEPDATDFRETARRLKATHYLEFPPGEVDLVLPFLEGRDKPQLSGPPPRLSFVATPVEAPTEGSSDSGEADELIPAKPTRFLLPSGEPPDDGELLPGIDFQAIFVPDNYKRVSMLAPGFLFEEINLGGHLKEEDYPRVVLMGGAALNHPDLVTRAGKYTEGTVLVDGFFLASPAPAVQGFVDAYRAAYEVDPTILEATSYDAALLLLQLLSDPELTTRRQLRQRLRLTTPVESVTGARGMGMDGEMRHEMLTLTVKKGAIVQAWPPPPPLPLPAETGADATSSTKEKQPETPVEAPPAKPATPPKTEEAEASPAPAVTPQHDAEGAKP